MSIVAKLALAVFIPAPAIRVKSAPSSNDTKLQIQFLCPQAIDLTTTQPLDAVNQYQIQT